MPALADAEAFRARSGLRSALPSLWRLASHADGAARRQLAFALVAAVFAALAEAATIGLVQVSLRTLSSPTDGALAEGKNALLMLILVALAGSILRYFAQRLTVVAQLEVTRSLNTRAFAALQWQGYQRHLEGGASEAFAALERLQMVCYNALGPMIAAVAALGTTFALLAVIAALYPLLGTAILIASAAVAIWRPTRASARPSAALSDLARERARFVYEARSAFRDVSLTNGQARMTADFADVESRFRGAQADAAKAAQSARYVVEGAGLLALFAMLLILPAELAGGEEAIPFMGVLGIAALRLLPQVAVLRSAVQGAESHADVIVSVVSLVELPTGPASPSRKHEPLQRSVELSGIHLQRAERGEILRGLDLEIARGARIGVIGESGAGKSTLLDILCGLLPPSDGVVLIDGLPLDPAHAAGWRDRIGVVSQDGIILGRTLREAIVYPDRADDVDAGQLADAIEISGVAKMATGLEGGLDAEVGEVMSRLSGGQRQRLALAHAIYRARDLLILDEATAQLDVGTEAAIVDSLRCMPRSVAILIVTHRPALLACCDEVLVLHDGVLAPRE